MVGKLWKARVNRRDGPAYWASVADGGSCNCRASWMMKKRLGDPHSKRPIPLVELRRQFEQRMPEFRYCPPVPHFTQERA